jgi:hypothetical protein
VAVIGVVAVIALNAGCGAGAPTVEDDDYARGLGLILTASVGGGAERDQATTTEIQNAMCTSIEFAILMRATR